MDSKEGSRDPFKCDRVPVKKTISFILNNITSSSKSVAFIHNPDPPKIVIVTFKENLTKHSEETIQLESDILAIDIKYVLTKGTWRLVVCTNTVAMVYSEDGKRLLFHMKISEGSKINLEETNFFKGVCSFSLGERDFIAVGNSSGEIKIIENLKENQFALTQTIASKDISISQLVSVNSDHLLVTGDIHGGICIYSVTEPKSSKLIKELDIFSKKSPINSMVSLDMKSVSSTYKHNYLCCGDFLGKLKIYNLTHFSLLAEISSHSRMVTTLDVKLNSFEIVSGSDDTFLNFWKLEEEGDGELKVSLKVSFRIADQMIVGAQYLRGRDECMISIYDSQEITVLKYEK